MHIYVMIIGDLVFNAHVHVCMWVCMLIWGKVEKVEVYLNIGYVCKYMRLYEDRVL